MYCDKARLASLHCWCIPLFLIRSSCTLSSASFCRPLPSFLCTSPFDLYDASLIISRLPSALRPLVTTLCMLVSYLCSRCSPRSLRSFSALCLFPDTAVRQAYLFIMHLIRRLGREASRSNTFAGIAPGVGSLCSLCTSLLELLCLSSHRSLCTFTCPTFTLPP
jgi:hypothetical protein